VPSVDTVLRSFEQRTSHRAPYLSVYLPPAALVPPLAQLTFGLQAVSGAALYVTTGAGADEVEARATELELENGRAELEDETTATEDDETTATLLTAKLVFGAYESPIGAAEFLRKHLPEIGPASVSFGSAAPLA